VFLKTGQKTYKKVIVTNHVIEIYEYEKMPGNVDFLEKDDGYDALDLENTKLEPKEERKDERRSQTLRDARNTARRLALKNFEIGNKFITLTFDPKKVKDESLLYSIDFVDKEFKKFIQRFNYKFDVKLKYLAVREQHKSGRLHFHVLCDWNKNLIFEDEIREWERYLGEKVWKHGFVDIKQLDHVDNVGAYIIKYMTKNVSVEFFKGKKIYLCSKGLERPFVYKDIEAEEIIKAYELDTKKEVFTNSYESEYNGKISYREYNLKRL
jgi:hypothetical protein